MANHRASVAVSLLIFCLLGLQHVQAQLRIFRTAAELREYETFSDPERLAVAAQFPASEIIRLTGATQTATAQEDVSLCVDCLPWLRRFPGGSIRWLFIQLDEFGIITDPTMLPQELSRNEDVIPPERIIVGGDFNRWLNITRVEVVGGAEDPDSKIFMCEVCVARDTPFEVCHISNYTNRVIGAPPRLNETNMNFCRQNAPNISLLQELDCAILDDVPQSVPLPDRSWFRDGVLAVSAQSGQDLNLEASFTMMFPIFNLGVFNFPSLTLTTDGQITYSTQFTNITMPMLGDLPPDIDLPTARAMVFNLLPGTWMCFVNNSLGSASVEYVIRECGEAPVIPDCAVITGSSVVFPNDGDTLPPGCDLCIRAGTSVILDCGVSAGQPPISYRWTLNGTLVSTDQRLRVREEGTYSCSASNQDNDPAIQASVLFFSPRAMITSRIVGRNTDGCERLLVSDGYRTNLRRQYDTCIFLGETLVVECSSMDPTAVLELRSPDGTVYNGTTAVIEVTMGNIDAANMTFSCVITNARGPCGQFEFQTSVIVFDPARIYRLLQRMLGVGEEDHLVAGYPTEIQQRDINTTVTLRCPTSGIREETTMWSRVTEDSRGCLVETPITSTDPVNDRVFVTAGMVGGRDDLRLTINNFNLNDEGTYVCRTENIAGVDEDVVSLVTSEGVPVWRTTSFSACDKMCRDGVRNRSVTCRNSRDMRILADFMCDDPLTPRPPSVMQCGDMFPGPCLLTPIWIPYPWSRCSQGCKGGYRYRTVACQVPMTGEVRPNYECNAILRPPVYETCPITCCVSDVFPQFCKISGPSRCGEIGFQQLCCWTCLLTVIP